MIDCLMLFMAIGLRSGMEQVNLLANSVQRVILSVLWLTYKTEKLASGETKSS
jgi:hypothetical protein